MIETKGRLLSGNALKGIAMVTMALDHIGLVLFPAAVWLRMIGRLAFPIFAYLIAEGCRYTRNKTRHFLEIFGLGIICQIGYAVVSPDLYFGVLLTFSLSVLLIYAVQKAQSARSYIPVVLLAVALVWVLCEKIPGVSFDYGFAGVMLPVLVSVPKKRQWRLAAAFGGIVLICLDLQGYQWWSLLALVPLALYSGQRGRKSFKYGFYIFYPLHLLVIYGIGMLMNGM